MEIFGVGRLWWQACLGDQPLLSPYLPPKLLLLLLLLMCIYHIKPLLDICTRTYTHRSSNVYMLLSLPHVMMTPPSIALLFMVAPALHLLLLPAYASRPLPAAAGGSAAWQLPPRFAAVSDLKRYLHRLGYLDGNITDVPDEALESAVSLYQSKLGLPVTGRLDPATAAELAAPRCGVPDAAGGSQRFAFFRGHPSWDRPRPFTLTYALSPAHGVGYLDRDGVAAAFARAFARWAVVIPVRFEEAADYASADVRIGFYAGAHGDGEPFDGVLGILAHAFSPESGRLHLDAAETWALDFAEEPSSVAVDLESVATHEIGHVLGLGHTSVKEAVMYPSLSPRTKKLNLRLDDVEGVQALYGSNPDFRFSSLAQSDTSAARSLTRDYKGRRWSEAAAAATVALICML